MELGWQDVVALGIVALAVLYLCRLALGAFVSKERSGCGTGCGRCVSRSVANQRAPEQVVAIGRARGIDRR